MHSLEGVETITQLAARVGRNRVTVWHWIKTGIVAGGRRVKLAAVRVGGLWVIDPDHYAQFLKACNPEAPVLPESPAAEKRRGRLAKERARRAIG